MCDRREISGVKEMNWNPTVYAVVVDSIALVILLCGWIITCRYDLYSSV